MIARWRFGEPIAPLIACLRRGGVLAVPTESSYGLAVDPRSAVGVAAIYRLKARDRGLPLPVVVAGLEQLALLGVDAGAPPLAGIAGHWPAPLTVVVPIAAPLPATAGTATVAVRVPAHSGLRALLERLGHPLTATSANLSGRSPVVDPAGLDALLAGHDAMVVDGGRLPGGPPSTLVAWRGEGWQLLREGAFPLRLLAATPGRK